MCKILGRDWSCEEVCGMKDAGIEFGQKKRSWGLIEIMKGCDVEARGWGRGETLGRYYNAGGGKLGAIEWKRCEGNVQL